MKTDLFFMRMALMCESSLESNCYEASMTNMIPIHYIDMNLEILTKLLNSVAKKYGCHVEYIAAENRIKFHGDEICCRHITEETLAFFPADSDVGLLPFNCPIDAAGRHN